MAKSLVDVSSIHSFSYFGIVSEPITEKTLQHRTSYANLTLAIHTQSGTASLPCEEHTKPLEQSSAHL